jgi:mannosyltransferase
VVVAAVLRLWGIGRQSMWYDEWLTARAASGDLRNLLDYVTGPAGIPPTYFGVMWGWARLVGDGDGALRLVSALAGVALVPVVWLLVRELRLARRVARVAVVLVAVNPMLVWYSQEARPYTLVALVATCSLWALARAVTRGRRGDLAWWVFAATLLVAVHYYAVFLVVMEAGLLLAWRRRELPVLVGSLRRQPRAWTKSLAPAAAVVLGLAPFAARQMARRGQHDWITGQDFGRRLRGVGTGALVGPSVPDHNAWMVVAAVVLGAGVLVAVWGSGRERWLAALATGIGSGAVGLTVLAKLAGVDAVLERYMIGALVPALLAVAIGLGVARLPAAVPVAGVAVVTVASVGVVATVATDADLQRTDWRAVAEAHDAVPTAEGERLLVINVQGYLGQPLLRYLDGARVLPEGEGVQAERIDIVVLQPSERPCNGLIGRDCNLFYLGDPPPEPWDRHFRYEGRTDVGRMTVDRYVADRPFTLTREDVVAPRWDFEWHALVLATGPEPEAPG